MRRFSGPGRNLYRTADWHRRRRRVVCGLARCRLLAALVACSALLAFSLPLAASQGQTLNIGIYQNEPKISFDSEGKPQGFFAEIIAHLAQSFGWRVTYVPCAWADCLSKLETGEIDVMPDVAFTAARAKRFQFGHEAVLHSGSYIYSSRARVPTALNELSGQRVAVLKESVQHRQLLALAHQSGWTVQIVTTNTLNEVLAAVGAGTADFGIVNRFFGEQQEHHAALELDRSQVVFMPTPLYFAYGNHIDEGLIRRMDIELARLKAQSGSVYYMAYKRWLAHSHAQLLPAWALWSLCALALVLSGSIAANAYFRRGVTNAAASLETSRQRFRDFAEASSDWFWEMDENLRFSYFSRRFEEITGVPPDRLLGKTREETGIPGVDPDYWRKHLVDLHAHRPFRNFIHPRELPNGSVVHLAISGIPVFDEQGRFRGYRGTGTDITQQKRAEAALADAVREAADANRAKSEFLAAMSHDLRTPLNAILGFSDVMRHEIIGRLGCPKYRDYAEDIHFSAEHLLHLVNDLLDLSRIESGGLQLERQPLLLSSVIVTATRTVERMAQEAGVALSIHVEGEESQCLADRRAIEQVTLNLLSNGIRHTSAGGSITISVASKEDGGACLTFADSGCGIPPDILPKLFDPYVRSDPLTASPFHGHGLGLPICKSLVEAHGGRIAVESALGAGTQIVIELPSGKADEKGSDSLVALASETEAPEQRAFPRLATSAR